MAAYTFTPINFTGDTFTQALGINATDQIVGFHNQATAQSFLLTLPATFKSIAPPASQQATAVGINKTGSVVGFFVDKANVTRGFLEAPNGTFTTQDEVGTAFNQLLGINDVGQEVGYSSLDPAGQVNQLAYIRQTNATYTLLDNATHTAILPTNVNSQATSIDNAGDVVGFLMPTADTSEGFLLTNGSTKPLILQFPGSTFTQALGINNVGQVVGFYNDKAGVAHGFIWSNAGGNGIWVSVDAPNATATTINGINDLGHMVGFDTTATATSGFEVNLPLAMASDQTTKISWQQAMTPYTGPLTFLSDEFVYTSPDNLNITATTPNVFLHSGPGEDALKASSGQNVLDGGPGSNFITNASNQDTDFIDARNATQPIWSTMNNFVAGDSATIFGVVAADFTSWQNGQGATGFQGLTTHLTVGGTTASLTLPGYTTADLSNGRLSISFGTDPGSNSPFMFVHAN